MLAALEAVSRRFHHITPTRFLTLSVGQDFLSQAASSPGAHRMPAPLMVVSGPDIQTFAPVRSL